MKRARETGYVRTKPQEGGVSKHFFSIPLGLRIYVFG